MSDLGLATLQVIQGPQGKNLFLYRGLFVFKPESRRGEYLYLVCQDNSICGAKGQLLNNPNNDPERFTIVSMDEDHNHYPHINVPVLQ